MSLTRIHRNPDGIRMVLPQGVLDIAERIQQGEPLVGWSGDPRMFVVFNFLNERYEVWRSGEDGRDRIETSFPADEFDGRVLRHLADHDVRRHDVLKRVDEHNARVERERRQKAAEIEAQVQEVLVRGAKGSYLPGTDIVGVAGKSRDPNSAKAKRRKKKS